MPLTPTPSFDASRNGAQIHRHSATLLILRAQGLFALVAILAKLLDDYTTPWVIIIWLLLVGPLMMALNCGMRHEMHCLKRVDWRFAFARSLLSTTASIGSIYAFQHLELALAFTLSFLTPLFLVVLAILWLGETVGYHRRAATIIGFAGAGIMLRPEFAARDMEDLLAGGAMIFAAGANALNYTMLRVRLRVESPSANMLATSLCAAAMCLIALFILTNMATWHVPLDLLSTPLLQQPLAILLPAPNVIAGLLLLATTASLAVISNGEAYLRAEASYLAPFNYIQLFWAALGGWAIWGEVPVRHTIIGAALIIGAGLYTIHRERVLAARRKRNAQRQVAA